MTPIPSLPAPRAHAGFSLVEVMVAITLSLFVLAGLGLTLANGNESRGRDFEARQSK